MSAARRSGAILALAVLAACNESTAPPAEEAAFAAPITGTPMADVFYGAYIDKDPGDGVRDWACGGKSYDGHKGVDILLRNFRVQDQGVPALAAAEGVVTGISDGHPDRNTTWDDGGGFGNHVVISHPGGLSTIYGHLRRGSIAVTQGERVGQGAVLGLVGSSGRSNWPHLHFEVRRDGAVVEPFTGPCSATTESLWADQLAYQDSFMVTDAGLTDQVVTQAVLLERPPTVRAYPLDAAGFRFWLQLANQRPGTVRFELRAPGGATGDVVLLPVGASFSMRYLVLDVPVHGALTQAGAWEIQAYQGNQLIWTEPFTLLAATAPAGPAGTPSLSRPPRLEARVIDQ
ncbi:MAG TPA: M23 family metallopeptidase, partial [Longimicrobium sp.]|nr:M23 family metallopeptidase [Longimicrobium sp.]